MGLKYDIDVGKTITNFPTHFTLVLIMFWRVPTRR